MGHVDFLGIAPVLFIFKCYKVHLFYRELNFLHKKRGLELTIFVSELGKFSPQHRGGLDASDTDSVDLTPENHGPHRMNRKQTANVGKNAYKVPQFTASITISDASESFKQLS